MTKRKYTTPSWIEQQMIVHNHLCLTGHDYFADAYITFNNRDQPPEQLEQFKVALQRLLTLTLTHKETTK